MDRAELAKKLDTIADIGIVNAKHDTNVIREAADKLRASDFQTILGIFKHRPCMEGFYRVATYKNGKSAIYLWDYDQDSVILNFDENGRLARYDGD